MNPFRNTSIRSSRGFGHKIITVARSLLLVTLMLLSPFQPFLPSIAEAAGAPVRKSGPHLMPFTPPGTKVPAAPSGAHLTYYSGPVISNMKSIDVSYGPGTYITNTGPDTWIPSFTAQYLGSGVMDWLNEYNTPLSGGTNQVIGRGTYSGTYVITPSSINNGSTIQDPQIVSELDAQIKAGFLPAADTNTSYAVFFRLGQQICQGSSCSLVSGGFCAYHGTFTAPNGVVATYQVIPDLTGTNGCGNSSDLNNTTMVLSHELTETITDPQVGFATILGSPLAWYDSTNGEIGDICNAQTGSFVGTDANTYFLQMQFSNLDNNCIVTRAVASDFSISAAPASLNVALGASDVSTISTAITSGSVGTVSLSVSGAPAGVTASLSPASVSAGGSSTLTVTVAASATPGPYSLTVTGTEGAISHSASLALTIPANDFSISASPVSLTIAQGASDVSAISTAVTSGAAGAVALSVSGAPTGVTASFSPASVSAGAGSTLTLAVDASAVPGVYALTVTGTQGSTTHSANLSLTIRAAPAVFPTSSILDTFNRANGGIGANWSGATNKLNYFIASNLLDVGSGGRILWKPAQFGASQEAFVTISAADLLSKSQGLVLKVQTVTATNAPGAIVVVYDATTGKVRMSTRRLDDTIVTQYADTAAVFASGDQLGAQVLANGTVKIYKNGLLIASITLNAKDQAFFNGKGGSIGLTAASTKSRSAVLDKFGGGNTLP